MIRILLSTKLGEPRWTRADLNPDGYTSWSPKEVFEKAYRELDCKEFINAD